MKQELNTKKPQVEADDEQILVVKTNVKAGTGLPGRPGLPGLPGLPTGPGFIPIDVAN